IPLAPHIAIGKDGGQETLPLGLGTKVQQRRRQDAMPYQVHAQRRAATRMLFMEDGLPLQGQLAPAVDARPPQAGPSLGAQRVFPGLPEIQAGGVGLALPGRDKARISAGKPGAQRSAEPGVVSLPVQGARVKFDSAHCRRMSESRATLAQVPMSCLMNAAKVCGSLPIMSSPRS